MAVAGDSGRLARPVHRGMLEIAYAVALDRGTPLPTAQDGDIAQALVYLDAALDERERG